MSWLRPSTRGPSFSLIPKRMIICLAVCVTRSRSLAAPVVTSWKTSSGRPPAERHLRHQRALRGQVAILRRQRDRVPERLPARDDRDLVHLIGLVEVVADERVAHLVVRRDLALLLREEARLLLGAGRSPA